MKATIERFEEKYQILGNGCWEWIACKQRNGYALFRLGQRTVLAHRFSREYFVGPIPQGLQIDHLCRNRACVNPDHLDVVTCRTNLLRGNTVMARNARKTHCPKGHPYSGVNTYVDPKGIRHCRKCGRAVMRRRYHVKKRAA